MDDALFWSRLQFAFTISYHYLFPQLTMGLAWIIVYFIILKIPALAFQLTNRAGRIYRPYLFEGAQVRTEHVGQIVRIGINLR